MIFELQTTIQQRMYQSSLSPPKAVVQTPNGCPMFIVFDILSLISNLLKKIIVIAPRFGLMMICTPIFDALRTKVQVLTSGKAPEPAFEVPEPETGIIGEN
jgi:hypothetical protein